MKKYVKDLNFFYLNHKEFWENDTDWNGFKWIACDDNAQSIISFRRIAKDGSEIICVCNFCPVTRKGYKIGVPEKGVYKNVFSSDKLIYGGAGTRLNRRKTKDEPMHGFDQCIEITIPAMSVTYYKSDK